MEVLGDFLEDFFFPGFGCRRLLPVLQDFLGVLEDFLEDFFFQGGHFFFEVGIFFSRWALFFRGGHFFSEVGTFFRGGHFLRLQESSGIFRNRGEHCPEVDTSSGIFRIFQELCNKIFKTVSETKILKILKRILKILKTMEMLRHHDFFFENKYFVLKPNARKKLYNAYRMA